MRIARAEASVAQHSEFLVLMRCGGVLITGLEESNPLEVFGDFSTEAAQASLKVPPDRRDFLGACWTSVRDQVEGQLAVARLQDVLAQLRLVRGKDSNAAAAPGDRDVPLLGIGRGFDRGIGEENVIDGFALGPIGGDRIPRQELAEVAVEDAAVGQFNAAVRLTGFHGDEFAVADAGTFGKAPIGFHL